MQMNNIEQVRKKLSHCIVDSCTGCPAKEKKEGAACKDYNKSRVTIPHTLASAILDILDEISFTEDE